MRVQAGEDAVDGNEQPGSLDALAGKEARVMEPVRGSRRMRLSEGRRMAYSVGVRTLTDRGGVSVFLALAKMALSRSTKIQPSDSVVTSWFVERWHMRPSCSS